MGLTATFLTAAVVMAAGALSVVWLPLHDVSGLDRGPAVYWPEPHLEIEPDLHEGPVLVLRAFTVRADRTDRFLEAMERVRRSRLRTGATGWYLYRDGSDPSRFVEITVVPTWAEHLRQHGGRLTGADQRFEQEATALAEGKPHVEHLFPARP